MFAVSTAVNFIELQRSSYAFKERASKTAELGSLQKYSKTKFSRHYVSPTLLLMALCVAEHHNFLPHTQKEGCFLLKEPFNFSLPSPRCLNNIEKSSNLEANLPSLDFSRPTHQYETKYCLKVDRFMYEFRKI